jgi:OFA family oxalate/formate antiporter-like MFS transporter
MTAFSWALFFDRCMNAACRPVFGLVSDFIGRENALALAFVFEAASIYLFLHVAHDPVWFIVISGLIFFGWGEIFTLMPIMVTETYGTKHAQTIYGWLYTAKGFASLAVPFATAYVAAAKNWDAVFQLCSLADVAAAVMALFVLKPMRRKYVAR